MRVTGIEQAIKVEFLNLSIVSLWRRDKASGDWVLGLRSTTSNYQHLAYSKRKICQQRLQVTILAAIEQT